MITSQEELMKAQIDLEQEQVNMGIKRYRDALAKAKEKGRENTVRPQHRLLVTAIEPMSDWLKNEIKNFGKAGKNKTGVAQLKDLNPDAVAFIVAQAVISTLSAQPKAITIESKISSHIHDYALIEELKRTNKTMHNIAKKGAMESPDVNYRRTRMRAYASRAGIDTDTQRKNILTGAYLLDGFIKSTGLVYKQLVVERKKRLQHIMPTEEVTQWLSQEHAKCELMSPYLLPMVVEPLDWTDPYDGGYQTISMPISRTQNKDYLQELEGSDIDSVYRAINTLQKTPWRINQTILQVANELWSNSTEVSLKVFPRKDKLIPPESPLANKPDIDSEQFKKEHQDEWRDWKSKATQIHNLNNRNDSKRIAVVQRLWMAEKFKDYDGIYFPHNMDWRGRVYPMVQILNPQSDDLGKALLEFGTGKPLGSHGEYWLKVHIANCFGIDKLSMEERLSWTDEHEVHLSMVANDPFSYKMWQEADSPWQFLAACFEWERYKLSGEGESFVSHLAINMDGSCNGLQNFSAMLKDEVGGKATNLVPLDTPADVYMEVADLVVKKIEKSNSPYAKLWEGKVVRKVVKRQVMTLPYGVSKYGMNDQLKAVLNSFRSEGIDHLGLEDDQLLEWQCIQFLTEHIWDSINEVVIAARAAMDWLKNAATIATEQDLPIFWTAPSGLPVVQDYRVFSTRRIDTVFGKLRVTRQLKDMTKKLDIRKQINGVAPNFVHSCDAAHMIATINRCIDIGITDFCMIHDSYGTHASDVETLQLELRKAFVEQYTSRDVLEEFREELMEQTERFIPEIPQVGTLDLTDVVNSKYFFA